MKRLFHTFTVLLVTCSMLGTWALTPLSVAYAMPIPNDPSAAGPSNTEQLMVALQVFAQRMKKVAEQLLNDPQAKQLLLSIPGLKETLQESAAAADNLAVVYENGTKVVKNWDKFDAQKFIDNLKKLQLSVQNKNGVTIMINAAAVTPEVVTFVKLVKGVVDLAGNGNDLLTKQLPKLRQALEQIRTRYPELVAKFNKFIAQNQHIQELISQLNVLKISGLIDLGTNLLAQAKNLVVNEFVGAGDAALNALNQTLTDMLPQITAFLNGAPPLISAALDDFLAWGQTILAGLQMGTVKFSIVKTAAGAIHFEFQGVSAAGTNARAPALIPTAYALAIKGVDLTSRLQNLNNKAQQVLGEYLAFLNAPENAIHFTNNSIKQAYENYKQTVDQNKAAALKQSLDQLAQNNNSRSPLNYELLWLLTRLAPGAVMSPLPNEFCFQNVQYCANCKVQPAVCPTSSFGPAYNNFNDPRSYSAITTSFLRNMDSIGATAGVEQLSQCLLKALPATDATSLTFSSKNFFTCYLGTDITKLDIKKLTPAQLVKLKDLKDKLPILQRLPTELLFNDIGTLGQLAHFMNLAASAPGIRDLASAPAPSGAQNFSIALTEFSRSYLGNELPKLQQYSNEARGQAFLTLWNNLMNKYVVPAFTGGQSVPLDVFQITDPQYLQLEAIALGATPYIERSVAHLERGLTAMDALLRMQATVSLSPTVPEDTIKKPIAQIDTSQVNNANINQIVHFVTQGLAPVVNLKACELFISATGGDSTDKTIKGCQGDLSGLESLVQNGTLAITGVACGDGLPVCGKATAQFDFESNKLTQTSPAATSKNAVGQGGSQNPANGDNNSGQDTSGSQNPANGDNNSGQDTSGTSKGAHATPSQCENILTAYDANNDGTINNGEIIIISADWTNGKIGDDFVLQAVDCWKRGYQKGDSGSANSAPLSGLLSASDLNGDGIYEDLNGDGSFNSADCTLLAQDFLKQIPSTDTRFDFDQDGQITFGDVTACQAALKNGSSK